MARSIPPRTMREVWRQQRELKSKGSRYFSREIITSYKGKNYKKPRQWQYITKPFFKRIKEPIVDVFKEAEEVQIIIDLGNFSKGELNFQLKKEKYFIYGKHQDCEFHEEIPLPNNVDTQRIKEIFRNNILQLIIPRKRHKK